MEQKGKQEVRPLSKYARKLQMRRLSETAQQDAQIACWVANVKQSKGTGQLPLLIDECVTTHHVCQSLRFSGYPILTVGNSLGMGGVSDDKLFAIALRHQLGIVTQDKGFLDHSRYKLDQIPALILFPSHGNFQDVHVKAVNFFCNTHRLQPQADKGHLLNFQSDGILLRYNCADGNAVQTGPLIHYNCIEKATRPVLQTMQPAYDFK